MEGMDEDRETSVGEHSPSRETVSVLAATRQPLIAALFGGLNAAASVLAVIFLAGGAVRRDQGMLALGVALVVGALVAAAAPRWLGKGQFARLRLGLLGVFLTLGAALAGRGVWVLYEVLGDRLRPAAPGAPAGAKDVLLVTMDQRTALAPFELGLIPGAFEVPSYFPSSPRRDPCLASVLTGLEVIEHRLLFDGGETADHTITAAEAFLARGYSTHGFGRSGLPGWARRGVQEDSLESRTMDPLAAAIAFLAEPSDRPRFLHLHLDEYGLGRAVPASMRAAGAAAAVAVVVLPSADGAADSSRLFFACEDAVSPVLAPVSSVSVLPTLLSLAGVEPPGEALDGPVLMRGDERPLRPAVTFAHGARGAVHDLTAHIGDWTLDLTLTPLGGRDLDDWQIDPPFAENPVYGNGVRAYHRATNGAPDEQTLSDLIGRLVDWRAENGGFEVQE